MREADVAIRMKEPSQADLIRKRLMQIRMRMYATPEYLAARGTPEKMEDFSHHRLICQHAGAAQVAAGATAGDEDAHGATLAHADPPRQFPGAGSPQDIPATHRRLCF